MNQDDYTYNGFSIVDGKLLDYKGKDKNMVIPDGVRVIGEYAIGDEIEKIYIPASVEEIDPLAFFNATDLQVISVAEDNPYFYSRDDCLIERKTKKIIKGTRLSFIPLDGSVTAIGTGAFLGIECCRKFINRYITTIESRAFGYGADITLCIEAKSKPEGWADDWDSGCGETWEEVAWEAGDSGLLLEWGIKDIYDDDDD